MFDCLDNNLDINGENNVRKLTKQLSVVELTYDSIMSDVCDVEMHANAVQYNNNQKGKSY
jgi:hypothetical protein